MGCFRDGSKNSILLKVEVCLLGETLNIIFTDAEETPPPFRIDNFSEVMFTTVSVGRNYRCYMFCLQLEYTGIYFWVKERLLLSGIHGGIYGSYFGQNHGCLK